MSWIFLDVAGEHVLNTDERWVPLIRAKLADLQRFEGYPEAFYFADDRRGDTTGWLVPFREEWLKKLLPRKRRRKTPKKEAFEDHHRHEPR